MKAAFHHGGGAGHAGRRHHTAFVHPQSSDKIADTSQRHQEWPELDLSHILETRNEGIICKALQQATEGKVSLRESPSPFLREVEGCLFEDEKAVEEICALLVSGNTESLREALLRLIDLGSVQMTEVILNRLKSTGEDEELPCVCSDLFPSHMTPLILASIKNNFELVCLLLNRGHHINLPHRADCKCQTCFSTRKRGENVESKIMRVDAFRAMSSSAYLWLASHDPILFAIQLSAELEKCSKVEKQFKDQYLKLSDRVRMFGRSVAQGCDRSEKEVHILLSRKEGCPVSAASFPLPRLRLALDAKMKELGSALSVQSEIQLGFMGKWADWNVTPPAKNFFFRYLPHTLGYPFTALIFLFSAGRLFKSYNYPFARYVSYLTSYLFFLICLTYLIQDTSEGNVRGFTRNTIKMVVSSYTWAYVFGMLWFDFLGFARVGARRFFAVWWNWCDIAQSSLFMFAFFAFVRSELDSQADGLRYMERKNWVFWDSQLVGEAFYGTATVISFWRVFYFLQLNRSVGPTIISIGKCIKSVFSYLVILAAVIGAYSAGVKYIYYGYSGYHYIDPKTGDVIHQTEHFLSWPETLRMLYWSFYGYLAPNEQGIVTGDLGLGRKGMGHGHWLNETMGEIILASFNVACIIVLLNLMIAMICTDAAAVIENEDVEWKFIRCHVWAEFFEESNSLPPPFNVIHWFVQWISFPISKKGKPTFSWPDLFHYDLESDEKENQGYLDLIKTLFRRYLTAEKRSWKTASELHQDESVKSVRLMAVQHSSDPEQPKEQSIRHRSSSRA